MLSGYLRKAANVADADDVDGEVPEKVDDLRRLRPQRVEEDEGRDDRRDELVQQVDGGVREQLAQFSHHLQKDRKMLLWFLSSWLLTIKTRN